MGKASTEVTEGEAREANTSGERDDFWAGIALMGKHRTEVTEATEGEAGKPTLPVNAMTSGRE